MTADTTSRIFVTTRLEGFHHWPGATPGREYLSNRHRHQFGVRVEIVAPIDNDRVIEFHDLIDEVRGLWPADGEWGANSCEVIAHMLAVQIRDRHGLSYCAVTVDEDGEAGATVVLS